MSAAPDAQAVFFRRRHQARRPPLAKIRPGMPAPAMGPGTAEGDVPSSPAPTMGPGTVEGDVPMVRLSSAKNPNCVVPPSGNPNAIDEIRESLVTPKKPGCGGKGNYGTIGRSSLTEELSPKVINAVYCGPKGGPSFTKSKPTP